MLKVNCQSLVPRPHNVTQGSLIVADLFGASTIVVQHHEAQALLLFKLVINCEVDLEVGIEVVVDDLCLPVLGPLLATIVPLIQVADRVTLGE